MPFNQPIDIPLITSDIISEITCQQNIKDWFSRNIGELDVTLLDRIEGDYLRFAVLLKDMFVGVSYNKKFKKIKAPRSSYIYNDNGDELSYENTRYNESRVSTYDDNYNCSSLRCVLSNNSSHLWIAYYDGNHCETSFHSHCGNFRISSYDNHSNKISYQSRHEKWSASYDDDDNMISFISKDEEWNASYDINNNMISKTSSKGTKLISTYDNKNNNISYTLFDILSGNILKTFTTTYGLDVNKSVLKYSNGSWEERDYDNHRNELSFKDSKGTEWYSTYDEVSNKLSFSSINCPESSWVRTYERTDDFFLQTFNGKPEIKVNFK